MHAYLGQIMHKIKKDQKIKKERKKPNCHFWAPQSKRRVLLTSPAHNTSKPTWHPPSSRPRDPPLPSLHLRKQLAPSEEWGRKCYLFSLSWHSRMPNKALPEFLVWPLVNFYCLQKAKNQVCNSTGLKKSPGTLSVHRRIHNLFLSFLSGDQ